MHDAIADDGDLQVIYGGYFYIIDFSSCLFLSFIPYVMMTKLHTVYTLLYFNFSV